MIVEVPDRSFDEVTSMLSEDIVYYRRRALAERSRMALAPTPRIASLHERLAELYEEAIAAAEEPGTVQDLGHGLRLVQREHSLPPLGR